MEHTKNIADSKRNGDTVKVIYDIYSKTIENIENCCSILKNLCNKYKNKNGDLLPITKTLFEFNSFIDFRLRYKKQLMANEEHEDRQFKILNLHKILYKLKTILNFSAKKKSIILNMSHSNGEYLISALDEIYLGFFIIIENAIKYSPMDKEINIVISDIDNRYVITIENSSEDVGINNANELIIKGIQGNNHKDGSGFGLFIANEIFHATRGNFNVNFDKKKKQFISEVSFEKNY